MCKEPLTSCFLALFADETPNASSSNSLVPSNFIEDGRTRNSPSWKNSKNHETNKMKNTCTVNPKEEMSVNHDIDTATYMTCTLL